jgi:hypothetical protein
MGKIVQGRLRSSQAITTSSEVPMLWVLGLGRPSLGWREHYLWYSIEAYSVVSKEGIRIKKEIRLDQLERFDQLVIRLDLGQ